MKRIQVCGLLLVLVYAAQFQIVHAADFTMIGDIAAGAQGSAPRALHVFNGELYFMASTPEYGLELWKVDNATSAPMLVKDINPGPADGLQYTAPGPTLSPNTQPYFANYGGKLYFAADDGTTGLELWRTDGTTSGTELVRDITAGQLPSNPISLCAGNYLYFRAASAIWRYDAATDDLLSVSSGSVAFYEPTNLGGMIVFRGGAGSTLWRSDGTQAGTYQLSNVYFPSFLTRNGSKVYFQGEQPTNDQELWVTDGSVAVTYQVKNLNPSSWSAPKGLAVFNVLYFVAAYSHQVGSYSYHLWHSDGTPSGTDYLYSNQISVDYKSITPTASALFYREGQILYKTDGTPGGLATVADLGSFTTSNAPNSFVTDGNRIYFVFYGELYQSDGTPQGTIQLSNLAQSGESVKNLTVFADRLFFTVNDGVHGEELWSMRLEGGATPTPTPTPLATPSPTPTATPSPTPNVSAAQHWKSY